jgi:hypothetical protein
MKMLWCWRCKTEMPMLDEVEFHRVLSFWAKGAGETDRERKFGAMLREYERITGLPETGPNAIYHHRLSIYGPPCSKCGKPLRTPRAKLFGTCTHPVEKPA